MSHIPWIPIVERSPEDFQEVVVSRVNEDGEPENYSATYAPGWPHDFRPEIPSEPSHHNAVKRRRPLMTIQEFLDAHLPTRAPKTGDVQRAWEGWIANLYSAATGNETTLDEVTTAMEAAGYERRMKSFLVSVKELGRVDRRYFEKMFQNRREGKGV